MNRKPFPFENKDNAQLLAMWREAQNMVAESSGEGASGFERRQYYRRTLRATEVGSEALRRGLVLEM